jgi:hypothetical protein
MLLNFKLSLAAEGERVSLQSCPNLQSLINITLVGHGYKIANLSKLSLFKIKMHWLNNQETSFDAVIQARLFGTTIVAANVDPSSK